MTDLGVVAIGRNEGERLRGCLESLVGRGVPFVYVDSGSTDGSAGLARSLGSEVVELDMSIPFSAARARNEGYQRLKGVAPGLRLVMFLDGDCEVADGWLDRARQEFAARPYAAVVCGRRREKFPERSIYNRLTDLEWDTPVGQSVACGGDAVIRAEAFEAVGGFDPTAAAGEEPELCQRLRGRGWTIWRVDAEMTRHDVAMTRFLQFWRRHYRSGYNGLDIWTRFPGEAQLFRAELKRARTWGVVLPFAIACAALLAALTLGTLPSLAVLALGLSIYPLQMARLAWKARRRFERPGQALGYGFLTTLAKWANASGQFGYARDRKAGRMARLIEYKKAGLGPEPAPSGASR